MEKRRQHALRSTFGGSPQKDQPQASSRGNLRSRPASCVLASLRIIRCPTGRRLVLLAPKGPKLPSPWVTAHLIDLTLRPLAVRTVRNIAQGIHQGSLFCDARGIDVVERCRSSFLLDHELSSLARHMRGNGPQPRAMAGPYYTAFIDFLTSVAGRVSSPRDRDARLRIEAFRKAAARHKPTDAERSVKPRLGLTEEQRDLFLRAVIPGSADNPFGTMSFRNFVLMTTAFLLGLRSGELLSLKLTDLDLRSWPGYLIVERRQNDPEDTRPFQAMAKTKGRGLPLSPELTDAFAQLVEERAQVEAANKHSFVFVNYLGAPLGERGLRDAYQVLRENCPKLEKLVNHMLRHDWNDRWTEMVDDYGWNPDECLRIQLDAQGWTPGSDMPLRYGLRSRERRANARSLMLQKRSLHRRGTGAAT